MCLVYSPTVNLASTRRNPEDHVMHSSLNVGGELVEVAETGARVVQLYRQGDKRRACHGWALPERAEGLSSVG